MKRYRVSASQTVYFEIEVDAETEQDAIAKVKNIDDVMDIEDYWAGEEALQIDTVIQVDI